MRFDFGSDGKQLKQTAIIEFGKLLKNKEEVQMRIQAAQSAILNPSKDLLSFIGTKIEIDQKLNNEISFSENTICLDV